MSFRGRGDAGNPNKIDMSDSRKFGGPDGDKSNRDDSDRFESNRRGRPPFGRGGRPSPGRDKPFNDRSRDYNYSRDEQLMRDRSPMHGPDDRFSDRFRKDDGFSKRDDHGRKDSGRPFYGDDSSRDRFSDSRSRHEGSSGNYGGSRFDGPSSMQYKPRPMNFPNTANKGYYADGFPKPNECEIIVVNKLQRGYAESVEDRVKGLGILVDILFLKDEALLTQTIDDIARRGSLYAMVISPQNETHGSVTVNILHGTPQEHRNMPLDDALKLLSRNFHEHIRSQRERMERERAERGQYIGVVADREMQFLLKMLADGRWISLSEINLVIRYLSERRDKMSAGGDERGHGRMPIPPGDVKIDPPYKPKEDAGVSQKEQDLQNRIINLMNQGAPPTGGAAGQPIGLNQGHMPDISMPPPRQNQPSLSSNMNNMRSQTGIGPGMKSGRPGLDENQPGPQGLSSASNKEPANKPVFSSVSNTTLPPDPSATATYINFDNPSVQKALDNLMQSGPNLLKNITLSASGVTNTPSNQSATSAAGDNSVLPPSDHLVQRGNMGPRGSDIGGNMGPRGSDIGGNMGPRGSDIGGNMGPRGSDIGGNMGPRGSDIGGNMGPRGSDIGGNMGPRGPDIGGNMGPRGPDIGGNMGPRGPDIGGNMGPRGPDIGGNMGPRGPDIGGNMGPRGSDMGGNPSRNSGNLDMGSRGPSMGDMGGPGGPRGGSNIPGIGAMGSGRGGYGTMPEMGHMNNPRGFGGSGMPDMGRMGPPRGGMGPQGQDLGPPQGMGQGGNFPNQNQYNKYQGPGQQGNFPGPYNSVPGLGGMSRQNYGGPPGMGGMGGGPRRY